MKRFVGILSCFCLLLSSNFLATRELSASEAQASQRIPPVVSHVLLSDLYAGQTASLRSAAEERGEKLRLTRVRSLKHDGLNFVYFDIASKPAGRDSWIGKGSLVAQVTADSSGLTQIEALSFAKSGRKAAADDQSLAAPEISFTVPDEISLILLGKDFSDLIAEMVAEFAEINRRLEITDFSLSKDAGIYVFLGLKAYSSGSGKGIGEIIGELSADHKLSRLEFKPSIGTTGAIGVSN